MDEQTRGSTTYGLGGRWNWLVGGAVGGVVGSILFGAVLWMVDPSIVTEGIPAIYGFDPGTVGWGFHLAHGLLLGIVFGFVISRPSILGSLTADVETGFIARMGVSLRFALAGMVYGLAIWSILPVILLPVVAGLSGATESTFPGTAIESLVGHLIYGLLLGALFSMFVETGPKAAETEAPFEEAGQA